MLQGRLFSILNHGEFSGNILWIYSLHNIKVKCKNFEDDKVKEVIQVFLTVILKNSFPMIGFDQKVLESSHLCVPGHWLSSCKLWCLWMISHELNLMPLFCSVLPYPSTLSHPCVPTVMHKSVFDHTIQVQQSM